MRLQRATRAMRAASSDRQTQLNVMQMQSKMSLYQIH